MATADMKADVRSTNLLAPTGAVIYLKAFWRADSSVNAAPTVVTAL